MIYFIQSKSEALYKNQLNEISSNKEHVYLDATKENVLGLISQINAIDLFNEKYLYIITGLDLFYLKKSSYSKKVAQQIINGLNVYQDDIVIEVTKAISSSNEYISQLETQVKYIELSENDASIAKYLENVCSLYDIQIGTNEINLLRLNLDNDITAIKSELIKLSSYENPISKHTIDILSYKTITANAFSLIEYIVNNQVVKSKELFNQLISDGEDPFRFLGLCAKQIEFFYNVKLLSQKHTNKEIVSMLKVDPYRLQKTQANLKNVDIKSLKKKIIKMAQVDYLLKQGKLEPEFIIDEILFL